MKKVIIKPFFLFKSINNCQIFFYINFYMIIEDP